MTATPFKAKAEERKLAKASEDEKESPERGGKRLCTSYEKQLSKMTGDLQLVKDMVWGNIVGETPSINMLDK
jgi:hypothetical protein